MVAITFQEARNFLNNINSKDKVAIVHHDDGDGFCSGILYYDWCKNKGTTPAHFAYSRGRSKFKDYHLEKFNKIIITDVAPALISQELYDIKDKKVLYSDHHPEDGSIPKEILEFRIIGQGYIPSSRTAYELTKIKKWLGMVGAISDAADLYQENSEFIDKFLKKENITLPEFKQNITSKITNFLIYFNKNPDQAFIPLSKMSSMKEVSKLKKYSEPIEKEIERYVKEYEFKKEKLGDLDFYHFSPKYSIKGAVIHIITEKYPSEIQIFASPKQNGTTTFSARDQLEKRKANIILKAGIRGLKNATAGGHNRAAGGMIQTKDLEKFKRNIREYLKSNPA